MCLGRNGQYLLHTSLLPELSDLLRIWIDCTGCIEVPQNRNNHNGMYSRTLGNKDSPNYSKDVNSCSMWILPKLQYLHWVVFIQHLLIKDFSCRIPFLDIGLMLRKVIKGLYTEFRRVFLKKTKGELCSSNCVVQLSVHRNEHLIDGVNGGSVVD